MSYYMLYYIILYYIREEGMKSWASTDSISMHRRAVLWNQTAQTFSRTSVLQDTDSTQPLCPKTAHGKADNHRAQVPLSPQTAHNLICGCCGFA